MHVQSLESSTHNTHTRHHKIRHIIAPQVSHLLVPLQALLQALQNSKHDTGRSASVRTNKMHELKTKNTNEKSHTAEKVYATKNNTMCMKLL